MLDDKQKNNLHSGHRQRLLNKLLKYGFESLEQHELLEVMLYNCYQRIDTNRIAHELLREFGSIYNICNAPLDELIKVSQVGYKSALFIKIIPELVKAYEVSYYKAKHTFCSSEEIGNYCVALQMGNKDEIAYLLCLDAKNGLIKQSKLAEGSPGTVFIEPRKVLEAVAHTSTVKAILCHNHPGGTLFPSQKDFEVTARIKELLKAIDVELTDHILVVNNKYISFRSENYKI